MSCHAILITRIPWVHVRVQQATRSHRGSRANSFSLGYTEKVTKNWPFSKYIWLQLPEFILLLLSYSNLVSRWGSITALICTRKQHRGTHWSILVVVVKWRHLAIVLLPLFFTYRKLRPNLVNSSWLIFECYCSGNCNLSSCKLTWKTIFGTSTGFELMASALALQCSTNWAMETNTLEALADQSVELTLTRERNETEWRWCVNCGNTNWIQMAGYDELSVGFEPIRNGEINWIKNNIS